MKSSPAAGGSAAHRPVLVIAGSDPLAYSGLQADLRHLGAVGVDAYAVPTCLTEQSEDGVRRILPLDPAHVEAAIHLAREAGPLGAVKIGMLHTDATVRAVARGLAKVECPIVLDPVLASTSGASLLDPAGIAAMIETLFPLVTVLTPNLDEARLLVRAAGAEAADGAGPLGRSLRDRGPRWVCVKGGHEAGFGVVVRDLLVGPDGERTFAGPRHAGQVPRGTGCAFSTLLAAGLSRSLEVPEAVAESREAVALGIRRAIEAGSRRLLLETGRS